jgi:hypothetical protein
LYFCFVNFVFYPSRLKIVTEASGPGPAPAPAPAPASAPAHASASELNGVKVIY